jgi:hypothetical protein
MIYFYTHIMVINIGCFWAGVNPNFCQAVKIDIITQTFILNVIKNPYLRFGRDF